MSEGDRYFSIVNKYNDEADKLLKGRGISPATSGVTTGKAGSIDVIEKRYRLLRL